MQWLRCGLQAIVCQPQTYKLNAEGPEISISKDLSRYCNAQTGLEHLGGPVI